MMSHSERRATDWESVRASFPGLDDKVFLDAACISVAPRQAQEAVSEFLRKAVMAPLTDATEHHIDLDGARGDARRAAAALIGASEEEIALVESTTHALNLAAHGVGMRGGENVILCDTEYIGVVTPWAARARESGFDLRFVRNREGRIEPEEIAGAMDERTRAICVSSVQWSSGYRLDLPALSALARERGALLILDSIQHLGAMPLDVRQTPVDMIACGGHKWLNAPFGCGLLYVRRELLPELRPLLRGYMSLTLPEGGWGRYFATPGITPLRPYEFVETAEGLETGGTSNYPGLYGFTAAVGLINEIGVAAIEQRIHALVDRLVEGMLARGFRLISPRERERRSGIVVFTASGDPALDGRIVAGLRERRVCVSRRYTNHVGGLRVSVHFFNNEEDIDTLVREADRARREG